MSVGSTSAGPGPRATDRLRRLPVVGYLAVSGLPGRVRGAWAKALGAEREGSSPWAHSDLWNELRQSAARTQASRWDLEPGTAPGSSTLGEQDLAALAAAASGGEEVRGRHPNICSTVLGRFAGPMLDTHPGLRVLVFYQSPWEAFQEACRLHRLRGADESRAWIDYWLKYHEDVLAARLRHPGRMFLVNAGRLRSRASQLLDVVRAEGVAVPESALAALARHRIAGAPSSLLAGQMAEHAPECWDMYEALESSALLLGREPEFRGIGGDEPQGLAPVLAVWSDALAASEVQRENELLLKQLQQVQEELGHYMRSNEAMREALGHSVDVANRARTLISGLMRGRS